MMRQTTTNQSTAKVVPSSEASSERAIAPAIAPAIGPQPANQSLNSTALRWRHHMWRKLVLPRGLRRPRQTKCSGQGCNLFSISKISAQIACSEAFTALRGKADISASIDCRQRNRPHTSGPADCNWVGAVALIRAMRYPNLSWVGPALLAAMACASVAAQDGPNVAALKAALAKNVDHAREWLDQKDAKSVAQSAGTIQFLAEVTRSQSDDASWQAALQAVAAKAGELQKVAGGDADWTNCKTAVEALDKAVSAAAAAAPTGKPQPLPRQPAIRSLMLTMDAVQGDAKVALLVGNVEAAKKHAYVLAELGKLVSNARNTDGWAPLAGDFTKAAMTAATATGSDPKTVREHFRGVAQRCESCHEKNRTR
jgi:hypothetical protein